MKVIESGYIFEFPEEWLGVCHDRKLSEGGDGNCHWKGVDFRFQAMQESGDVWVEVKNFGMFAKNLPSKERRLLINEEIRQKLTGTTAFLFFSEVNVRMPVTFEIVIGLPPEVDLVIAKTWFLQLKNSFVLRQLPHVRENLKIWVGTVEEFAARHPSINVQPIFSENS